MSDRERLFDLLERVWGERPNRAEFEWWFDRSPAGAGLLTTEVEGSRVVGLASMSFVRAQVAGRAQLVAMPLQVATDADQRGKGIFSRLELVNEEAAAARGCEIGVTFPNDASRPIFLERLRWQSLWRGHVWVRPPVPAIRAGGLRIDELRSIPAEVEGLAGPGSGQIADAAFLDWRYLSSPRPYRVRAAFDGERLRGVLAFRALRGRVSVVCHALGDVAQLLRATGSPRPTIALVPDERRRDFVRAGFLPTPKRIHVLGKRLGRGGDLGGRWQFQLGDFDVV